MTTRDGRAAGAVLLQILEPFSRHLAQAASRRGLTCWAASARCESLYDAILWGPLEVPIDFLEVLGRCTLAAAEDLLDALREWAPDLDALAVCDPSAFRGRLRELASLIATLASVAAIEFKTEGFEVEAGFVGVYDLCTGTAARLGSSREEAQS